MMVHSRIKKIAALILFIFCITGCIRPAKSSVKEASDENTLAVRIEAESASKSGKEEITTLAESETEIISDKGDAANAENGDLSQLPEGEESQSKGVEADNSGNSKLEKADVADYADSKLEKAENADSADPWVEARLSGMTIEEKVAQLFFVSPESLAGVGQVIQMGDTSRTAFSDYPVGGIIYFGQNLQTPEQSKRMIGGMAEYALSETGIPVFLTVDEEGGRVTRFERNPAFGIEDIPAMKKIGETGDPENAFNIGATIGQYLNEYGINLDLAPDADVLVDANNTAIGDRSFGSDPYMVSKMALAYADGLKRHNVLSCYKHYPGHGGTKEDTHEEYAYSYKTLDELMNDELIPFSDAIENDIPFIMVSHISLPEIHGDDTPASLSKYMVTDVLREQLGYEGIIITDALDMGAISNHYSYAEACKKALLAGDDMLLMSGDFRPGYEAILDAVKNGEISEDRIDESVRRILRTKKMIA